MCIIGTWREKRVSLSEQKGDPLQRCSVETRKVPSLAIWPNASPKPPTLTVSPLRAVKDGKDLTPPLLLTHIFEEVRCTSHHPMCTRAIQIELTSCRLHPSAKDCWRCCAKSGHSGKAKGEKIHQKKTLRSCDWTKTLTSIKLLAPASTRSTHTHVILTKVL